MCLCMFVSMCACVSRESETECESVCVNVCASESERECVRERCASQKTLKKKVMYTESNDTEAQHLYLIKNTYLKVFINTATSCFYIKNRINNISNASATVTDNNNNNN